MEFGRFIALESFRNIRHDGHSGATNLIFESKIACKGAEVSHLIDFPSQDPCLLPRNQVLETFDRLSHDRTPTLSTQHSALSTQHSALSTQHSALSTQR